jgi:hypothetical protein
MSRINANTTLRVEDYPAEYRKELLPRLFQTLNLLITQLVNALNGNIEFGINIPSQDTALEFNYAGTLPSFKWPFTRTPKFVLFGQAYEDGSPIALAFTWSYSASNGLISLTSALRLTSAGAAALKSGSNYKLSVRTLA